MTPLTMALLLAWRDPARQVALIFGVFSILYYTTASPSSISWSGCFIAPAFFLSVALTLPTFSAFELSLPITREQLLWSRIVGSLAILWLPLLAGTALWMYAGVAVRQPIECALQFTAMACLFTFARLAPRRAPELACGLLGAVCAVLALLHFTLTMALIVGGAAALPLLAKVWWTCVPDRRAAVGPVVGRPIWPFLRLTLSWKTLALAPLAFFIGTNQSWSSLAFLGLFLIADSEALRYCLALPITRRYVLLGRLAPLVLALLVGAFAPMDADGMLSPDRLLSPELRSGSADWRHFTGGPLGITVPLDYYVSCPRTNPPPIVSPWGETAEMSSRGAFSLLTKSTVVCNPFWLSPKNSDQFFEWQFARATGTIYGKPLRPAELIAAVGAGLKPVMRQTRMRILDAAFGTACLLLIALIAAAHANYAIPNLLRKQILRPFALPVAVTIWLPLFCNQRSDLLDSIGAHAQPFLFRLSVALPESPVLTVVILLTSLAALYWLVEALFNGVEFPEKPKETA